MKTAGIGLVVLLLASSAHAQDAAGDFDRYAQHCRSLPDDLQGDCMEMRERMRPVRVYYTQLVTTLAAEGQPRELAMAAKLASVANGSTHVRAPVLPDTDAPSRRVPADPRIAAWRRDALARSGDDVVALAMLAHADPFDEDKELRLQAAARWQALEPDNLAPLLFGDLSGDALLSAAAERTRFDLHMYEQVRWMQTVFLRHPFADPAEPKDATPEEWAAIPAMSLGFDVAMPGLRPLLDACRGVALDATSRRRTDCRAAGAMMAEASDSLLGANVGIGLLEGSASNDAERAQARERRRRFDWRMWQWGEASSRQPRDGAAQFAQLLRDPAIEREQQLMERVLRDAGIDIDPPAGWQPPRR